MYSLSSSIKNLLLVLSLFLPFCNKAQTFFTTWGTPGAFEAGEAVTKYGNDIIMGGTKNDSAFVMRVKSNGDLVWMKCFKPGTSRNLVTNLFVTSDHFITGTGYCSSGSSLTHGFYFKIDSLGNFMFLKSNSAYCYFKSIQEKNATEYVGFAGHQQGTGNTDLKIFTIDRITGNVLAQTDRLDLIPVPGFSHTDDMEGAAVVGSNFYTTGRLHLTFATDKLRPYLVKHRPDGEILWAKYLHKPYAGTARAYPQAIIHKSPNHLYIPYLSDEFCSGGCTDYVPGLMKVDTAGNVIWDRTYNILSSNGELTRGFVTDGLNFYLVGYTNYNVVGSRDIFVLKVDPNGTLLQSRSFATSSDQNFLVSFIQPAYCDSSYIYISGASGTSSSADIFLMKIDTALNLACGATNVSVNTQVIAPFSTPINHQREAETVTMSNPPTFNAAVIESLPCNAPSNLTDTIEFSGTVILDATYATATSYLWNTGDTGPTISASANGIYTCVISIGCCSFIHTFVIDNCSDLPINIVYDNPTCLGDSLHLVISGPYTFTTSSGSATYPGEHVSLLPQWGNNSITVNAVNADGCTRDTSFNFYFDPQDSISFIAPPALCYGDTISIVVTGNYTFTWDDGTNLYTGHTVTVVANQDYSFTITGIDSSGCQVDSSYAVDVLEPNEPLTIAFSSSPCEGETVTIDLGGTNNYLWSYGSTTYVGNSLTFIASDTVVFHVEDMTTGSCAEVDTVFTFIPLTYPAAEIVYDSIPVTCGQWEYHFHPLDTISTQYSWYLNGGYFSSSSTVTTNLQPGFNLLSMVANNQGCADSTSLLLQITEEPGQPTLLYIPNIFTPNNDGVNDEFRLTISPVDQFSIMIFNRWGQEVFSSSSITNSWDGNFNNAPVTDGMYLYIVQYSDVCKGNQLREIKDWVHVSR